MPINLNIGQVVLNEGGKLFVSCDSVDSVFKRKNITWVGDKQKISAGDKIVEFDITNKDNKSNLVFHYIAGRYQVSLPEKNIKSAADIRKLLKQNRMGPILFDNSNLGLIDGIKALFYVNFLIKFGAGMELSKRQEKISWRASENLWKIYSLQKQSTKKK